jgi:tripartite-type tricarboxylate transporter receptor subunit TctC
MPSYLRELLIVALAGFNAAAVCAADYPQKPIRLLSPGPGGGADYVSRFVAQGLEAALSQHVVVDNRPAGLIPGQIVAAARADGYTLLVNGNSFWIAPLIQSHVPYDPVRDFTPVTLAVGSPNVLVVHASLAANSVAELLAAAKARPGQLNYASSSVGGSINLAAELFKYMSGAKLVRINYKSSGAAVTALVAGEVQLMFANAPPVMPHVKSGRLKALAVTTAAPSALFPGLPTVAAAGLPGYDLASVYALFAPARTPAAIVARLNQTLVRYLGDAAVKEKFFAAGMETIAGSPEELAGAIRAETARMRKVIDAAGIHEE